MITDPQVFEGEYVPDRLLHRDAEVQTVARAFDPALTGDRPKDVLIHGPHGVGKTVLTRHTFGRLQKKADADWAHIRTMGKTTAGIIRATLRELGADPARTTPQEDLCLQLRELVDQPTIVVLDEGDELPTDALRRLADIPLLAMVPIVHNPEDFRSRLDDQRISKRFLGQELPLDKYGTVELADILEPRARDGLGQRVDHDYLQEVADRAGGGARKAIQTLGAAGRIADKRNCAVKAVDVEAAYQRGLRRVRRANLRSLPFHHQVLYELIRQDGSTTPPELHHRYEAIADDVFRGRDCTPISKRARRNKLRKLREYELVEWDGDNQHRVYCVTDTSVEAPLTLELPAV